MFQKTAAFLLSIIFCFTAAPALAASSTETVLVIDTSGTMIDTHKSYTADILPIFFKSFISSGDIVHLVSFDSKPVHHFQLPVTSADNLSRLIMQIESMLPLGEYSDIPQALAEAEKFLEKSNRQNKIIAVVSDGMVNLPPNSSFQGKLPKSFSSYIHQYTAQLNEKNISLYFALPPYTSRSIFVRAEDVLFFVPAQPIPDLYGINRTKISIKDIIPVKQTAQSETSRAVTEKTDTAAEETLAPAETIQTQTAAAVQTEDVHSQTENTTVRAAENVQTPSAITEAQDIPAADISSADVKSHALNQEDNARTSDESTYAQSHAENIPDGSSRKAAETTKTAAVPAEEVHSQTEDKTVRAPFPVKNLIIAAALIAVAALAVVLIILALKTIRMRKDDSSYLNEDPDAAKKKQKQASLLAAADQYKAPSKSSLLAAAEQNKSAAKPSLLAAAEQYKSSSRTVLENATQQNRHGSPVAKLPSASAVPAAKASASMSDSEKIIAERKQYVNSLVGDTSASSMFDEKKESVTIELYVENQNPAIGLRNVHTLTPGARKSLGGGYSSYSIFLYPVPVNIAELHFDGRTCRLLIYRPEFFPYTEEAIIEDCINKKITVLSSIGVEIRIMFITYVSETDKLNKLLLSIIPDDEKNRYLKS